MGKQGQKAQKPAAPKTHRHPLLIFRNLGRRYRPVGLLLIVLGALAFLPTFIGELQNEWVDPAPMAAVGLVLILVGIAFWLFAALALRRAYVQCLPDVVIVRTPFHSLRVSYRRITSIRAMPVAEAFKGVRLGGMGRPLVKPLRKEMAVVVMVKSWPVPKRGLRRRMGRWLFVPKGEGWVLIVPDTSRLMREMEELQQRKLEADRRAAAEYEDPIDRLRYFRQGR